MKLDIKKKYLKEFAKIAVENGTCSKEDSLISTINDKAYWGNDESGVNMDTSMFPSDESLILLREILRNHNDDGSTNGPLQNIAACFKIAKDPKGAKITKLEMIVEAMRQYISKYSKNYWIFKETKDGFLPYVIVDIKYEPAHRDYPANTSVSLKCFNFLKEEDSGYISWGSNDIKNKPSIKDLLTQEGWYIANEELMKQYNQDIEKLKSLMPQIGEQYISDGYGISGDRSWDRNRTKLVTEGVHHKLVIDELTDKEVDLFKRARGDFWDEDSLEIPIHPYIRVFDLEEHGNYYAHVKTLRPYKYDTKLIEKLILPTDVKELITILGQGVNSLLDDIVEGKSGGIIIMASGSPGTGKTLSAEVYSEFLQRPLYVVQCSQLGTDPDTLEKRLKEVLRRASKWNAVLLIDEADVYVYERGKDIKQNAIVGVFLRLLEFYKGVMFLTTNRSTLVDDAIMSRVLAHIKYDKPSKEDLIRIWEVQRENFQANINDSTVKKIVDEFPYLSGRGVRNLTKLSKFLSDHKKEKEVSYETIKRATHFAVIERTGDNIKLDEVIIQLLNESSDEQVTRLAKVIEEKMLVVKK